MNTEVQGKDQGRYQVHENIWGWQTCPGPTSGVHGEHATAVIEMIVPIILILSKTTSEPKGILVDVIGDSCNDE